MFEQILEGHWYNNNGRGGCCNFKGNKKSEKDGYGEGDTFYLSDDGNGEGIAFNNANGGTFNV